MGAPDIPGNDNLYDVIVVGGGPAGLTAAIYLARARYRVLVLEKEQFGGQITITHEVVNYPGIGKVSGKALTDTMHRQAESFGAEFLLAEAENLELTGDIKTVHTSRGTFKCFGILLATGAHPRTVGFTGEEEHKGRGVAYCATCDGEFFTGKDVYVVGGGYAAAEESVFLTKFARHVTILIRGEDFTCAASVADEARNHPKISILTNTVIEEVSGENGLNYIKYKNTATNEVTEFRAKDDETFGVFVFVGYAPETKLVKNIAHLNEHGYIITDASQKTNINGLYAAGDVCIKPLRQVVTATGDGALAATELEKYVAAMQQKTGLQPKAPTPVKQDSFGDTSQNNMTISHAGTPSESTDDSGELFTAEMKSQLDAVFKRMARPLTLMLYLDNRPISNELEHYMNTLASLTDKLTVNVADRSSSSDIAPCVRICTDDGTETGLAFHGVPGGHEFTSFVLGLFNAAGPGQAIDNDIRKDISAINKSIDIKIVVTLSCNMCPDLVVAAQRIAAESPNITAEVYDINHFEELKKRYNVMSVPCFVINDDKVFFGKKNISQLLDIINNI
ncbi:MAG: FAD-dependent oxidoreductase [Lachnospiraceae bacterium]|nr:FAD-dependent oxidoreductase [Lachnospiraceae bacterium]